MPRASQIAEFNKQFEEPSQEEASSYDVTADQVLPPVEEWNYQGAEVNQRGEALPEGAQAWRPDGLPHFGDGLSGKLKSYWWNYSKDVPNSASVEDMTGLWNQSKEIIKQNKDTPYWQQENEAAEQFRENIFSAFSGKGTPLTEEQTTRLRELAIRQKVGDLSDEDKAELKELGKGSIDQSSLSGLRRGVGVAVSAGLDLFNAPAYGTKQVLGAARAAGEALEETGEGSKLPSLVGDLDLEQAAQLSAERKSDYQRMVDGGEINPRVVSPSISWQIAKNNLKATLLNTPLGLGYNALRTALSPSEGKWDVVKDRMAIGWDSGRILYTQVYDPMVRFEYERRLNEGENPELLALELQNPWAEMVGEILLDPLNVVGAVMKGGKVAGKIDEAQESGKALVRLLDPTMDDSVALFKAATTNEGVERVVRETAQSYVDATAKRVEARAQKYGWSQLTSTSQRARLQRDMSRFFGTTISSMVKDGRAADDIADIMKYGIMSVSDDVDEVAEGIAGLMNASVPKQFFSELGNDSLTTVRRMITNSDGALDANKITKALSSETPLESVMKIADDAAAQRFSSVQEMEKAAKAVESGKATDAQVKLAKAYEGVPEHIKNFTKVIQPAEKTKGVINSGLGFFYFTINPGTAVRNSISNKMFIMMDEGAGAFFDGGVFKGVKDVREGLTKKLGYEYKVGDTFGSQAGDAPNMMAKIEAADALRVMDTRYTEAFGKITETALPFDDTLKAAGMNDSQFKMFKELVKKEGNMQDAMQAFNEMQGLADWRTLDFLNPTQVKGLKQSGKVWDDLLDIAKNPNTTLDDIDGFIDAKIKAYADNASQSANDVPGFSHNWKSSEDGARYGKAVKEKYVSSADYTKMGQYQEAAEQAVDEYKNTLVNQIKALQTTNPEAAGELGVKYADLSRQSGVAGKTVSKEVDGLWQTVWETKNKVKNGDTSALNRTWKELGFDGIPPTDDPLGEMFSQARIKRSAIWEDHFATSIARSEELIADLERSGVDTNDLQNMFARARDLDAKSQEVKSAFYLNNGKAYTGAPPKGTKLGQMNYDSANQFMKTMGWDRGTANGLKNAVNKDMGKSYKKWQDVPWNEAMDTVKKRGASSLIDDILKSIKAKQVIPVHPSGADPSVPRQFLETQKGFTETMEYLRASIKDGWGNISPTDGQAVSQALAEYGSKHASRLIDAKSMALENAEYWRDFTLLGYSTDKTFGNLAHSYVMPYAFWYSGTYRNMAERLVTDPQVIAGYAKYKHANEQAHKFAPDWYKQQVKIDNLFGVELDNPLFFNLEQILNPLNGLTGVDFNDRSKRKDWFTSTLDDAGKFGPSMWAPIQIATAISLSIKGDQDGALRWGGRLIPQSPAIKAAGSLLTGKQLEIDPNVLLFGGGDSPFDFFGAMDSYERGRVARALGDVQQEDIDAIMADQNLSSDQKRQMVSELEARYTDIAFNQEGEEWSRAYTLATNLRAPGAITSPLLGVGFKARTTTDLEIDEMYTQMNMLMTMRDGMVKEDYQKGWEQLREQFPFMDTVLLARKGGELRDGAYAYNVLGRIQPGKTDDIFREMKIDDLANKFYENKGSMEGWKKTDKDRFMSAILDIGATFAVPPDATKQEWKAAKDASNKMYAALDEQFGEDIYEKVTEYYGVRDENYQAGRQYLEIHPEVQDYLNAKSTAVATNPLIYKYYGSLQTIESYTESNLRAELADVHGEDIFSVASEYSSIPKTDKDTRRQWFKDNKESGERLRAYWDDLYAEGTERKVNEAVLRLYNSLPESDDPLLRGDTESVAQQALVNAVSSSAPATEEIKRQMPEPLLELVADYWAGEELPEEAITELQYIANRYKMSVDSLLVIAAK